MRRLRRGLIGGAALSFVTWLVLAVWVWSTGKSVEPRAVFEHPTPWVMAHRGGLARWPENTELAFTRCVDLGVDVLELDVHASRDDTLVVIHDPTVDRTTEGTGRVRELSLAELQSLDAGYRWTDGSGHPHRGQGHRIPTLRRVLEEFPQTRVNIEMKDDGLEPGLCELLRETNSEARVIVASVSGARLQHFRDLCPEVATSASAGEALRFWLLANLGLPPSTDATALQVVPRIGVIPIVTRPLVWAASKRGVALHVFTVNDETEMRRLVDLGVDGIMTDRPERLRRTLGRP